jgi:hypothetical protein
MGCTGSASTRVFQMLSAGNAVQLVSGTGRRSATCACAAAGIPTTRSEAITQPSACRFRTIRSSASVPQELYLSRRAASPGAGGRIRTDDLLFTRHVRAIADATLRPARIPDPCQPLGRVHRSLTPTTYGDGVMCPNRAP